MGQVIVIGGGVMGLATARELREHGCGAVTLLERRFLGAGSSGKSGAILRTFYPQPVLVQMARDSRAAYRTFAARTGIDIGFRQPGMMVIGGPAEAQVIRDTVAVQQAHGVAASVLVGLEILSVAPDMAVDATHVAGWEPEAAYVDPVRTVAGFAEAARRVGVTIREHTPARGLVLDGGRVAGVKTDQGIEPADAVVLATGAWSDRILEGVGVTAPIVAVRPEQAYFETPTGGEHVTPIVADLELDVYYKCEGGRGTRVGKLGYEDDERIDPESFDEGCSGRFVAWTRGQIMKRLPRYENAVSWGGCGAIYAVTPDSQAIIGPVPEVGGLWLVAGFSGHGFKLAPSVGRGVAEWITAGRPSAFDATFFAPLRFRTGGHRARTNYPLLG